MIAEHERINRIRLHLLLSELADPEPDDLRPLLAEVAACRELIPADVERQRAEIRDLQQRCRVLTHQLASIRRSHATRLETGD